MKKKKPGFTLIEMIIVVALTVIILGIASSMFITGNKVFSDSNVKSTLQIVGQAIQEKISNIGMQALNVKSCKSDGVEIINEKYNSDVSEPKLVDIKGASSINGEWIDVSELEINSSGKNSEYDYVNNNITNIKPIPISYVKASQSLSIDSSLISKNVKSMRIRPINIIDKNSTIGKTNTIEFNIELTQKDVTYPINFTITFRNKGN